MNNTKNNQIIKDGFNMENAVEIKINDTLNMKVNVYPSLEEKLIFVQAVVNGSFINDRSYQTLADSRFDVLFLVMFSDYQLPDEVMDTEGKVDIAKAYNHIKDMNVKYHLRRYEMPKGYYPLNVLITLLENDVRRIIEIENQKYVALISRNIVLEETLENINTVINKGVDFLNDAIGKINEFMPDSFSESMSEIIKSIPKQYISSDTSTGV